jgi:hypothetical protein
MKRRCNADSLQGSPELVLVSPGFRREDVCVLVSDDPRVGTELAGYRIESLLGWGGMSVAYLAEDLRLKRRVALKMLVAGLPGNESFRERFLGESELPRRSTIRTSSRSTRPGRSRISSSSPCATTPASGAASTSAPPTRKGPCSAKGSPGTYASTTSSCELGGTPRGSRSRGPLEVASVRAG